MKPRRSSFQRTTFSIAALLTTTLPWSGRATTYSWQGGGGNNNWDTSANWQGQVAPPSDLNNTDLLFGASSFVLPYLDQAFSIHALSFINGASAYTFSGSALTLGAGGLTQNSTSQQVFNVAVRLGADQTWTLADGGGALTFSGGVNTTDAGGTNRALTLSVGTSAVGSGTVNGVFTGGGSLTKAGAGTLILTGNSTYTGTTTINAGTLQIGDGGTGGTLGTGNVTDNAALVFNRSNNSMVGNVISGTGSLTKLGAGSLTFTGASTLTGDTLVGGGSLLVTTGSFSGGRNFTVEGTVASPASVTLGSMGSPAGSIAAGTVNVGVSGAGAFTQNGSSLSIPGDSALNLAVNVGSTGSYTLNGGTINTGYTVVGRGGSGTLTQNGGAITNSAEAYVGFSNGSVGVWNQSAGNVSIAASLYLGYGAGSNGTYTLSGTNSSLSTGGTAVGNNGRGTFNQSGGSVTTNGNDLALGSSRGGGGTYTLSGGTLTMGLTQISKGSSSSFLQTGGTHITGTLGLSGNYINSQGTYTLAGGTFNVGTILGHAPSDSTAGTSVFHFAGGTLQAGASTATLMQGLTTADVQTGGARIDTQGFNVTVAQNLTGGTASGATDGGLVKLGSGTLTLSGNNTYTGGTTINAGTLLANNASGSATGTGAVSVNAGATLGGTGQIAGSTTVQGGGTLDAGINGPGRLTLAGTLSLNANSLLAVQLGGLTVGSGYDQVTVGGQVTINGQLGVSVVNGFTLAAGQTFTILLNGGNSLTSGVFANAASGTLYTDSQGDAFLVNYAANMDGGLIGNDVTLTYMGTNVPEPSTWAIVGLAALLTGIVALKQATR